LPWSFFFRRPHTPFPSDSRKLVPLPSTPFPRDVRMVPPHCMTALTAGADFPYLWGVGLEATADAEKYERQESRYQPDWVGRSGLGWTLPSSIKKTATLK